MSPTRAIIASARFAARQALSSPHGSYVRGHCVQVDVSTQDVTTLAGSGYRGTGTGANTDYGGRDGTGTSVSFDNPSGLAVSLDGATLYVADYNSDRIRSVCLASRHEPIMLAWRVLCMRDIGEPLTTDFLPLARRCGCWCWRSR